MTSNARRALTLVQTLVALLAVACGQSHSQSESGQEFSDFDADAGAQVATDEVSAPTNDKPKPADSSPQCPIDEVAPGVAELEIYSDSLGGQLPATFSAHCGRPEAALDLMATDGLSTLRLATAEPGRGDMDAQGSFEFEDLATFAGHCNVCLGDRAGTLSCPSLIWKTGDDLVKASVSGSFRCDPAE